MMVTFIVTQYKPNIVKVPITDITQVSISHNKVFVETRNGRIYEYLCKNQKISCKIFNEVDKLIHHGVLI